jgi:uncharacterized membrane protein (UPF0127 family)
MTHAPRLAACLLLLALPGCNEAPEAPQNTASAKIETVEPQAPALFTIVSKGGQHRLTMEMAVTETEQERGLMFRKSLSPGHGMLFPFFLPKTASFWMKDTPVALDLLFIRPDGTIAAILPGKPLDLSPISAGEPVIAVAEITQGAAASMGIAEGDHVRWGQCTSAASAPGSAPDPRNFCPPTP